jgi:hypothetical protein
MHLVRCTLRLRQSSHERFERPSHPFRPAKTKHGHVRVWSCPAPRGTRAKSRNPALNFPDKNFDFSRKLL